jgi:dihydrofolate synthase / folylpolyglutamate synthase
VAAPDPTAERAGGAIGRGRRAPGSDAPGSDAPGSDTPGPRDADRRPADAAPSDDRARYADALGWLLSFADWERGVGWNPAAAPDEQWKLGRTRALLDLAGAPDRRLRIVLIAGTKGKGSTAAFLEAIARAGGRRTALYTQPHLHTYRERIKLDGAPIPPGAFADLVGRLRPLVDDLRARYPEAGEPTTFELTTVLAVLAAAAHRADLAILEVGLGGRLDATNAADPLVSVITTIGHDHTQILGRTLRAIAGEKAGIVRTGGTVVSAAQRRPALEAIRARCDALGARLHVARPLPRPRARPGTPSGPDDGRDALATLGDGVRVVATLGMAGAHQRRNAGVAVAAARLLADHGLPLDPEAVRAGLASATLPGRFEVVPGAPTVVVDAAHNVDSARALAALLADRARRPRPLALVLGILRDKDARGIVRPLAGLLSDGDAVLCVAPPSPRALAASDLAAVCRAAGLPSVARADDVPAALGMARERAGPGGTVVVTGSFSTVAAARAALGLVSEADLDPPLTSGG